MYQAKAYHATSATAPLAATMIERRDPKPNDVQIEILFCGVCHSDLHAVRNEWPSFPTTFPCVPGHEIVGRVTRTGREVTKFRPGDLAAVGCMVDSDRDCHECLRGLEQLCPNLTLAYNSSDRLSGGMTYGGYSDSIVVDQHFTLKVPATLDPASAAPLVCAGITAWSPLRRAGVTHGKKVGIIGLGGLGHMAVKFAHALGAHVVVLTSSADKGRDAIRLGADDVIIAADARDMTRLESSFDFLLDTISATHDINEYLTLLRRDGNLTLVGLPSSRLSLDPFALLFNRRRLSGSMIGGITETQEMLDFCGAHGITAEVEVIRMQQINEAFERLLQSDVKYRFSVDMSSLRDV